jgi:hypothetical protein
MPFKNNDIRRPMDDPNVGALNYPPSSKALRYQRMKAYGNHF